MKAQTTGGGVWLPDEVFLSDEYADVSYGELIVLCKIASLAKSKGYCYASNGSIANMFRMNKNFVSNCIAKLKDKGLVRVETVCDKRRIYTELNPTRTVEPPPRFVEGQTRNVDATDYRETKERQIQSRPSDRDGKDEDETSMGFLNELEPKLPNNIDTRRAIKLKEALKAKDLLTRYVDLKSWSRQFRILRQSLEKTGKEDQIKPVLKWHCEHVGEQFAIKAWSAAKFKERFDDIRNSMNRQFVKPTEKKHIEHDKHTKSIYRELENLNWPKGSKTQLLDAIQDSVTEYESFRKGLFQPDLLTKAEPKIARLIKELRLLVPGSTTFVRNWFHDINTSVQNWDAWSGNLRSMGVSRTSKKFMAVGRGWTDEYCGDPERWDILMELMKDA